LNLKKDDFTAKQLAQKTFQYFKIGFVAKKTFQRPIKRNQVACCHDTNGFVLKRKNIIFFSKKR